MQRLFDALSKIDGKSYSKFRDIEGSYSNETYTLHIDSVQGSPTSDPTRMRVTVSQKNAGFPDDTYSNMSRRTALGDIIARRFWESARTHQKAVSFPRPGQEILRRGSLTVADTHITVSFGISLPSAGKNAAGKKASDLFRSLTAVIEESLFFRSYKRSKLYNHLETNENADHVRSVLDGMGLCAFVSNESVLPRREDGLAPMNDARLFVSNKEMTIEVPNGGPWTGLGVKKGFTVVTGASFSGKSTFIDSLAAGVYNHIPGDGREKVVTVSDAMFIARQGRPVHDMDISATTRMERLDSEYQKGPLAESAALAEALGLGCSPILMDEDSSSPQMICRDPKVSSLFSDGEETILPLTEIPFVSAVIVSTRDAAISAADHILVCGDTLRVIEQDVECRSKITRAETRCPIPAPGRETVLPDVSDMRMSADQAYMDSLRRMLSAMRENMDGQTDIATLCSKEQGLSADTVEVRPADLMMAMNRCDGLSMVIRKE